MTETRARQALEKELKRLENRLDELSALCARLREENHSLRDAQDSLVAEKANLLQKSEQVRNRVEAMINRLRALEQST